MSNTVIIGFAGSCKSDIILYLSRILHVSGERTAIIDRSDNCELVYSVPYENGSSCLIEYRGVDVYLGFGNVSVENLPVNDYSAVLVDLGTNPHTYGDIGLLKVLIIVTDLNRHHIIPLSSWLGNLPVRPDAVQIIRDTVYGKIRAEYIESLLRTRHFTNLIASYELPFDEKEYSARLLTQYDDVFKFSRIPKEYKAMLTDIISEVFEKQRRDVRKALKKAQQGG